MQFVWKKDLRGSCSTLMGIEGFLKDFAIEALGETFGGGAGEMKTIKEVPVFAPGSEIVVRDALRANEVCEL